MAFLSPSERTFLQAASELAYGNPFVPERIQHERAALGGDFVEGEPVWSLPVNEPERPRANVWRIVERLENLCERLRGKLSAGASASADDLVLYEDEVVHLLYQRYYQRFFDAGLGPSGGERSNR